MRARVGGIVLKRRYQEGSRVMQGQPMFLIDPEPVRARLSSARAEVAVAKARLDEARRNRDRVLPLFEKNAVSQSRRDEAVSGFEVAQANVLSAAVAAAHGAAGPGIHRRARADLGPGEPRSALRRQPGLDRPAVEPADEDRAGGSAVHRVLGSRGRSGAPAQRSGAGEPECAAAGREADPGRRQRISAGRAADVRRQRGGMDLGHGARARSDAEQGRAADSGSVHSRPGRRRHAQQRRVDPAQGADGRPAGRVRVAGRRGLEGADAPGPGRPQLR